MIFRLVFQNKSFNLTFLWGWIAGIFSLLIGSYFNYKIQSRLQEKQQEQSSQNLERQLEQSERNLKLQLFHKDQKKSIEDLWAIIHSDTQKYSDMSSKLLIFLESVSGHYLPSDIQNAIRKEISEANSFLIGKEKELGLAPPDPSYDYDLDEAYADWFDDTTPMQRLASEREWMYERFVSSLKHKLRKIMSGS